VCVCVCVCVVCVCVCICVVLLYVRVHCVCLEKKLRQEVRNSLAECETAQEEKEQRKQTNFRGCRKGQ